MAIKSTTFLIDSNYYLWRAFSVVVERRNIDSLKKNVLSMFLTMVGSDAAHLKATHILASFDSERSFRDDIYKDYKANRKKNKGGTVVQLKNGGTTEIEETAGSFVKPARKLLKLAGITTVQDPELESDDILGAGTECLPGRIYVGTRDKDLAGRVTDRVNLWWPREKRIITPKDVFKYFNVHPHQIRDYLVLLGDQVDNIPGVPGVGPKTAARWLAEHDTLANAIRNDPKIKAALTPHKNTIALARKLVTLRVDKKFSLDALVPQKIDEEIRHHVWKVPENIRNLSDARKALSMKGLFS